MKKVIIICGGPSSEYEISLLSTQCIVNNIDYDRYSVSLCLIGKDKKCSIDEITGPKKINKSAQGSIEFFKALEIIKQYDIALLGTHGQFGEDGVLQQHLEEIKIKYTGTDSYASRLCMDKYRSSIIVKDILGVAIPKTEIIRLEDLEKRLNEIKLPVFIKPNKNGSSVCTYVVNDLANLNLITKNFYAHHKDEDEILIQEFIDNNVEISCGCLEKNNHDFIELPPIEITPNSSIYFDYKAKYIKGESTEKIPATGISKEDRAKISKLAANIHKLLGCRLYSRSDFLVKKGKIYYIETNTLPGMTETSLIPQEANAIGINYKDLISFYIENA